MLIGIDASRANRKFKGGTEWYAYYLIIELAKIDSTNQYVLYSDKPLTEDLADLTAKHKNFKIKILNWPFTYFWTQARLSLEMLFHAPDVLFVPSHTLPLIHPKRSVVTIHDIGFERQEELYSSDKIGPVGGLGGQLFNLLAWLFTGGKFRANVIDYHNWSTRFSLKHAIKIIAVSEFTRQELINVCGAPGDKIKVVYNGYNAELYKPISNKAQVDRALTRYGVKCPCVFYVGRLEKKKNTARLVSAFGIMREKYKSLNHKLVLVGNASLGFDEIKYVIEEFDLNNEVIITGWVPEADMPYIYNAASLFVFPSLYEGFGIPLVQAMACQVPIAASDTASIPEITAGAALLFNPKDEADMAEKMAEVLLDKQLAQDLIVRGEARVVDFSLAKCAHETLAILVKM
jgi:glycosyltransferase involved in cell wall biosynthesis